MYLGVKVSLQVYYIAFKRYYQERKCVLPLFRGIVQKSEVNFVFYDNLALACQQNGMKIATVVKECGGAVGSIDGWKKGAIPRSDIVAKLSLRLNVTTDFLIFGNNKQIATSLPKAAPLFTQKEQQLLAAYKAHPELQFAVDKLLGIDEETETVRIAARSEGDDPIVTEEVPRSKVKAALEDRSIQSDEDM